MQLLQENSVLTVIEEYFLHFKSLKESCATATDWLDLRDGNSQNSTLLKRLCGWNVPVSPILTTANTLFIHMHTDETGNHRGFILEYKGKSNCFVISIHP